MRTVRRTLPGHFHLIHDLPRDSIDDFLLRGRHGLSAFGHEMVRRSDAQNLTVHERHAIAVGPGDFYLDSKLNISYIVVRRFG